MAKRMKMSRQGSKRLFTKTARSVHKKNIPPQGANRVMRGGIRL